MKRAITFGGGGSAMGLEIGALAALSEADMIPTFQVWSLSCIGAWVGIVYNQFDGEPMERALQTRRLFREVFRRDENYAMFPTNNVFAPDTLAKLKAFSLHMLEPRNFRHTFDLVGMMEFATDVVGTVTNRCKWNDGDLNALLLKAASVNPFVRILTSFEYLSKENGLARIYYPGSTFMKQLNINAIYGPGKPVIYHNAYNMTKHRLEHFVNNYTETMHSISDRSLCACSALPHILRPIVMFGDTYCEGALKKTLDFTHLLDRHPDLDEVWIVPILSDEQVKPHSNKKESLENLTMLFGSTVGRDQIELFKYQAKDRNWKGKIIEIPVAANISYDWSQSNYDHSIHEGYVAATKAIRDYNNESP